MARLQLWEIMFILAFGELATGGLVSAQMTIDANTPYPSTDGSANTVMGVVGFSVASSLLHSHTNALYWGTVPSDAINAACKQIVDTGSYELTATVNHNWGDGPEDLTFQVENIGGCLANSDGSGTEVVATDQNGRRSAVVCPDNAGQIGCVIWVTGDDVDEAYNNYQPSQRADYTINRRRGLLDACAVGAGTGAAVGVATGIQILGPIFCFSPFLIIAPEICVAGLTAVAVGAAAGAGCGIASASDHEHGACFPGDALVQLQNGKLLPMRHLEVGHRVAVWKSGDTKSRSMVTYDEIYAFGHKDASRKSSFNKITMTPVVLDGNEPGTESRQNLTRTLELSGLHFVPTMKVSDGKHQLLHKRAKDIAVGDYVWALADHVHDDDANSSSPELKGQIVKLHVVTTISLVLKQGLYNPFTLSGSIVVNGVVASVHSDWFLDGTFDMLGISSSLPYAYQAVLALPRVVYKVWPKELYVWVYNRLDAHLQFGTNF